MTSRRSEPPRRIESPARRSDRSPRDLIATAEAAYDSNDGASLDLARRAVAAADKKPDGTARSHARRVLSRALLFADAAEDSLRMAEEAVRIAKTARHRLEEALGELTIAEVSRTRGEYVEGIRHVARAHALASREENEEVLSSVQAEYALLLARVGDFERARDMFDKVLAPPLKLPPRAAVRALYNAAASDRMAGRFSRALERIDLAFGFLSRQNLESQRFTLATARAATFIDMGAFDEAEREVSHLGLGENAPAWQKAQAAAHEAAILLGTGGRPEAVERVLADVRTTGLEPPTRFMVERMRALALLARGNRLEAERLGVSLMTIAAKGGTRAIAAQALAVAARAGNREAWLLRWLGALALASGGASARLEHESLSALTQEPEPIGGLARNALAAIRSRLIFQCPEEHRASMKHVLRQVETRVTALRESRHTESALSLDAPTLRAKEELGIAGSSPSLIRAIVLTARASKSNASIVVTGETGSGKELFARLVHQLSSRKNGPFVAVNCAAIPEPLLEAELFGHERGAFTGAERTRRGFFVEAEGGTLFLDEVGEMSAPMQVKLLRVLEDGEVRPIGGTKARKVDVRVVTATHRDLAGLVASRAFREDLFYRLAAITVRVPSLRERLEDVPAIAKALLERDTMTKHFRLEVPAIAALAEHAWPGNVRELANVLRAAAAMAEENVIERPALEAAISARAAPEAVHSGALKETSLTAMRARHKAELRELVGRALAQASGNKLRAARALGVSRQGLYRVLEDS